MNRLPTPIDLLILIALAAVFLVGCLQVGVWFYETARAFAVWVFP